MTKYRALIEELRAADPLQQQPPNYTNDQIAALTAEIVTERADLVEPPAAPRPKVPSSRRINGWVVAGAVAVVAVVAIVTGLLAGRVPGSSNESSGTASVTCAVTAKNSAAQTRADITLARRVVTNRLAALHTNSSVRPDVARRVLTIDGPSRSAALNACSSAPVTMTSRGITVPLAASSSSATVAGRADAQPPNPASRQTEWTVRVQTNHPVAKISRLAVGATTIRYGADVITRHATITPIAGGFRIVANFDQTSASTVADDFTATLIALQTK